MNEHDLWQRLASLTPARIGLGRAGAGLPTREVLRFGLAHAQARDAVHTPMDASRVARAVEEAGFAVIQVASTAPDRATYLRRPDYGRRLDPEGRKVLAEVPGGPFDLALVIGDGLSARAIHENAAPLLAAFRPHAEKAGWTLSPVVIGSQARVALGDDIGEALKARAAVMLIGERPGLSSPDSLGLYLTFAPRPGRSDAERNCISNIRAAGLSHAAGAYKLNWLVTQAFARGLTGVNLKDDSDVRLGAAETEAALPAQRGP